MQRSWLPQNQPCEVRTKQNASVWLFENANDVVKMLRPHLQHVAVQLIVQPRCSPGADPVGNGQVFQEQW
jgi:hypothetical protein